MFESKKIISKISIGLYQGADTDSIDDQLTEVIKKAIKSGVNHFDVAPNYRNTRSEKLLGALIQKNNDIYISTKGGFVPFDFSNKNINEEQYIQDMYIYINILRVLCDISLTISKIPSVIHSTCGNR